MLALAGGLLLGLIEAYVQYFFSGGWTNAVAYGVFLLVLMLMFSGCARRSRATISSTEKSGVLPAPTTQLNANDRQTPVRPEPNFALASPQDSTRININTASAAELEKLPGVGRVLAERIIEHREQYGPFRRPEHLIIVRGISDRRFRALRELITVE